MLSDALLARLAVAIAGISCLAVMFEHQLPRRPALRGGFALLSAVAGLFVYFPSLQSGTAPSVHDWEMFHYVLGAKYAPELGYERLYVCVAVADADNGHSERTRARMLRDLRDDSIIAGEVVLAEPSACTARFSAARWSEFRRDVALFRSLAGGEERWSAMLLDHGYNPSPVWTLLGRPLSSARPLDLGYLQRLAWLDPILMATAVAALAWAFGLRTAWLACVFWSTQSASSFTWTGGAFLRQDWLTLALVASALLRKQHGWAAGVCLTWSALLRVFPLLFFVGPGLVACRQIFRRRQPPQLQRRFWLGAGCGLFVLVTATLLSGSRPSTYRDFAAHLYVHARTPIANHMSLRTLISFHPSERFARLQQQGDSELTSWPAARLKRLERRFPLQVVIASSYVLGVVYCCWRLRTVWLALGLGFPLVMVLTDPSAYYYSMVLLTVPLARARRSVEVMLLGLATASQLLVLDLPYPDERYVALSALYLAFAAVLLAVYGRRFWAER